MKGRLKKIEDKWVVEYSKPKYDGGNRGYSKTIQVKTLPLLPKNQEYMNCFLYVDHNTEVDFKEVFINPMGREVDHTNLGQNHSGCVWYAELTYEEEDKPKEIKLEDVFNEEKKEKVKEVIHQHKVLQGLSLVNPIHLQMTSNGHGEFPDGYKLTEKGIQYIIEKLNKE